VAIADNEDIVIAYQDARDDVANRTNSHVYLYRYDKNGKAVWDANGVAIPSPRVHANAYTGYEGAPQVVASGDHFYVTCYHGEQYQVKADSTNWEPSWWDPDEEMPDSIQVSYYDDRYMCVNNDGTLAWESPMIVESTMTNVIAPCAGGDFYRLYANSDNGLNAQRINKEGKEVWKEPVTVEKEALTASSYMTAPTVLPDNNGNLVLVYRKINGWYGYGVYNRLDADGTTYGTGVSLNGSDEGNFGSFAPVLNNDTLMVAWEYKLSEYNLYANAVNVSGNGSFLWPDWPFDNSKGVSYDTNTEWGMKPVKAIRQSDGWVILYGNVQSWNGANFMVLKIDDYGNQVWSKQICNDNFKCSGYSVVSDGKYAYIFLIVPQEYDSSWQKIVGDGGMRVMCVELTDGSTPGSGVNEVNVATTGVEIRYDLSGREVGADYKGIQIVKSADGTVKKVLVK